MPAVIDRDAVKRKIRMGFEQALEEKQLVQISMRDIAAKSGMSHQKIYYYYESKDALLQDYITTVTEIYTHGSDKWRELIQTTPDITVEKAISYLFESLFSLDEKEHHTRVFVQIYGYAQYNPSIKAMLQKMLTKWQQSIKDALFFLTKKNMDEAATALLVLIEGMHLFSLTMGYCKEKAMSFFENLYLLK